MWAMLVCATAAGAQPVRLTLEVRGGVEAQPKIFRPPGSVDADRRILVGRAPVQLVAENTSAAPVTVPVLRFAGSGLTELAFELETGITGFPASPPWELAVKAGSPASFELVRVAPGDRVIMIADDAAALEFRGPHEEFPSPSATVAVTVTFQTPGAGGPYHSNAVLVPMSATLDPTPFHSGPGPDPNTFRRPR